MPLSFWVDKRSVNYGESSKDPAHQIVVAGATATL